MEGRKQVAFNERAHDKIAQRYEKLHTEIFNDTEQRRLIDALTEAQGSIRSNPPHKVLDIGCGSGNLTKYLLSLGFEVTAADVSTVFLGQINEKFPDVHTYELNGADLKELLDNSFDMVATYSVLHHIPDYLSMVTEMCRVLKSGGILYIDHEKNESFWNEDEQLFAFYKVQAPHLLKRKILRLLSPAFYINRLRRIRNPRYQAEGDIHVFPDDHIEWDTIKEVCEQNDVHAIIESDYLLYDSKYDEDIYNQFQLKTNDTKAIIFRKS